MSDFPITVITGLPGHGKTLRMLQMLDEAARKGDRPIYAAGIDGLAPGLAEPLDDPRDWQSVKDGSIIFCDESWKWFGHLHDARQAPTPKHVLALAEVRHRGISFVMTTQMVNQLYPFMRGLIGPHVHVVRHMGMQVCTLYTWSELNEDVKSQSQRERALSEKWVYPTDLFASYKSATMHTIKRSIPWRVALIPLCFFAALGLGWVTYIKLHRLAEPKVDIAGASGVAAAPVTSSEPQRQTLPRTSDEWVSALTPTLPGIAFTAPLFHDSLRVQTHPRTLCYISGDSNSPDSRCKCVTEQATPLNVPAGLCKDLATVSYYDPFRGESSGVGQSPTATPSLGGGVVSGGGAP